MIAFILALVLDGRPMLTVPLATHADFKLGSISLTRIPDEENGVMCYVLNETYRGPIGFSCVVLPFTIKVEEEAPESAKKPRKTGEVAQ